MKYLAIDTSGKNLTVIACNNDKLEVYFDAECGVSHSVQVMTAVEKTAEKVNLDLKEVDFFVCVVGAGSFTGIRIGVASVKALCFAYQKPCLSITSFDTIAYNKKAGKNLAIIDAKHNGYYVCGYDGYDVILPPSFKTGEEVSMLLSDFNLLSFEKISAFDSEVVSVSDGLKLAIDNKQSEITADLDLLVPLYVRKSQAEEGRP